MSYVDFSELKARVSIDQAAKQLGLTLKPASRRSRSRSRASSF